MESKKCSHCHLEKPLSNFSKSSYSADGLRYECKICSKIYNSRNSKNHSNTFPYARRRREFIYFVYCMYKRMHDRTKNYDKHHRAYAGREICSKREFVNFAKNNNTLFTLYANWQKSGFKLFDTPSVDRKNNDFGYSLDNIQFLTLIENIQKH